MAILQPEVLSRWRRYDCQQNKAITAVLPARVYFLFPTFNFLTCADFLDGPKPGHLKHNITHLQYSPQRKHKATFDVLWLQISFLFLPASRYVWCFISTIWLYYKTKSFISKYNSDLQGWWSEWPFLKLQTANPLAKNQSLREGARWLWLKAYLKITDLNCVPVSSRNVHLVSYLG